MLLIPGINLGQIIHGRTLGEWIQYYVVNVEYLETIKQDEFEKDYPDVWEEMLKILNVLEKMQKLFNSFENDQ